MRRMRRSDAERERARLQANPEARYPFAGFVGKPGNPGPVEWYDGSDIVAAWGDDEPLFMFYWSEVSRTWVYEREIPPWSGFYEMQPDEGAIDAPTRTMFGLEEALRMFPNQMRELGY